MPSDSDIENLSGLTSALAKGISAPILLLVKTGRGEVVCITEDKEEIGRVETCEFGNLIVLIRNVLIEQFAHPDFKPEVAVQLIQVKNPTKPVAKWVFDNDAPQIDSNAVKIHITTH